MKFKFKTLAAAAAMAITAMPSFATISSGADPSLLLVVYDNTFAGNNTYYRNLGSLSSLAASGVTTFASPGGSIFSTQIAGLAPGDVGWSVIAVNNGNPAAPAVYFSGMQAGAIPAGIINVNLARDYAVGAFPAFGALDNAANGFIFPNNEYTGNPAQGGTNAGAKSNAADTISAFTNGANGLGGAGLGTSENFYRTDYSTLTQQYLSASGSAFDGGAPGGYFTLAADGTVTWTNPAVSAVPLPAAAWLFGPGLVALFGTARRRASQA